MASDIKQFSEQLREDFSLQQALSLDEHQVYTLRINKNLWVKYGDLNPGLSLMGDLGTLPKETKETFLMSLMQINLFGKGTGGGVLGLDAEHQGLTFTQTYPYELTYKEFKEALEDFINYVELLKEQIRLETLGRQSLFSR